jgi:predicted dehydrogenase
MTMNMNRRHFLQATSAAVFSASAFRLVGADSPTKRYRTALIGCGWWGGNILGAAMAGGACEITALCDVDQRFLDRTNARVRKETRDAPKLYCDYRELLEKTKPDICIVATPDHWHPLIMIAAVQAGAHVYVEKPISHTILEGRAMVRAARVTNRVVQVGTHRRASPHNISAREFVRAGKVGKLGMIRAFVNYGGGAEPPKPNTEPPPELDWDLWCGPAPKRPFNGNPTNPWGGGIHPRGFRQYLDYANGQLGDWGIHWLDQILWITGEQAPTLVSSIGGRPVRGPAVLTATEQTSDAPDHQLAQFKFRDFDVSWEHRMFAGHNAEKGENVGCYFFGTEGTLHLGWQQGWTFYPTDDKQPTIHEDAKLGQPDGQNIRELWADFLDAIPTGRKPMCDIEDIQRSTNCALLGMLSLKLGRSVAWDGAKCECPGDAEGNRLLRRAYRGDWKYPEI